MQARMADAVVVPSLRIELRQATDAVHQRLHQHPGLYAVAQGTIDRTSYARLLTRLHGFHLAFEAAIESPPSRSAWLAADLASLGSPASVTATAPPANPLPRFADPAARVGALYVVEGSALGGSGLARQLDGLLGAEVTAGRAFFIGHGAATGIRWRRFLERLDGVVAPAPRVRAIAAAVLVFAVFEAWMADWDPAS